MRIRSLRLVVGLVALQTMLIVNASATSAQSSCQPSSNSSCAAPGASSGSDPTTLIGSMPPATEGKDLTGTGTLTLSSLLGKPTAVVFWLNSCPHCRAALPAINKLGSHLGSGEQIVTAAINAGLKGPKGFETPAAAVKTLRLRLPTVLVANDVAQRQWLVASTPTAYVINSRGVITQVLQPSDAAKLAEKISSALAETQ